MRHKIYNLEDIIHPHKLDHSKHDQLIHKVASNMNIVPNYFEIAKNAYYKLVDKNHKGGYLESDFDLIGLLFDNEKHDPFNWKEVPFSDSTILVYEMKTHDSFRNRNKAEYQLNRHNELIQTRTDYKNVEGFYCYNVGNSFVMHPMELK